MNKILFRVSYCVAIGIASAIYSAISISAPIAKVEDRDLLSQGQPWDYRKTSNTHSQNLTYRNPTRDEMSVIQKAQSLFNNSSAKVMALIDDDQVVWVGYKPNTDKNSLLAAYSITKTVTSMGIGKAICDGKLSLNSVSEDIVPEIKGTDLGKSTIRDLLMMSSGTWEGTQESSIMDASQRRDLSSGRISLIDIVKSQKINSAEKNFFGHLIKPGQDFSYHSTDPLVLGIALNKVTGTTYAKWIDQSVLTPAGVQNTVVIGQDRFGYGYSAGEVGRVHMTIEDWMRFAIWVKRNEKTNDCFGNYVKEASKKQISNDSKKFGYFFNGYGYLIWTDNKLVTDSYWASGWGGQRLAWNHKNNRMLIVFSNIENYMQDLYWLYRDWAALP